MRGRRRRGRTTGSLDAELRYVLTQRVNRRLHMAEFRERTARIAGATAGTPQTDSAELIREDRDVPNATPQIR